MVEVLRLQDELLEAAGEQKASNVSTLACKQSIGSLFLCNVVGL